MKSPDLLFSRLQLRIYSFLVMHIFLKRVFFHSSWISLLQGDNTRPIQVFEVLLHRVVPSTDRLLVSADREGLLVHLSKWGLLALSGSSTLWLHVADSFICDTDPFNSDPDPLRGSGSQRSRSGSQIKDSAGILYLLVDIR